MKNRNAHGFTKTDELVTKSFKPSNQKGLVLKKNLDFSQSIDNRYLANKNLNTY